MANKRISSATATRYESFGEAMKAVMRERRIGVNQLAYQAFRDLDYSNMTGAKGYLNSLRDGFPYGTNKEVAERKHANLVKLNRLFNYLDLPEDHKLVTMMREIDPNFNYRGNRNPQQSDPVRAELEQIVDSLDPGDRETVRNVAEDLYRKTKIKAV